MKFLFSYSIPVLLLSFSFLPVSGQVNMVPNPSFEDYNSCPITFSALASSCTYSSFPYIKDWVRPTGATSDYFNTCATTISSVSVPNNYFGRQAARTGSGYCGFYTYAPSSVPGYAEYIECKLKTAMAAGKRYRVSFFVSLGDNCQYASSRLGVFFSDTEICTSGTSSYSALTITPSIAGTRGYYYTDTSDWEEINDYYIASGGEQWMTIGRFYDTASHHLLYSTTLNAAYYYIDDVDVHEEGGIDTTICVTSLPTTLTTRLSGVLRWNTGDVTSTIVITSIGKYWCRDTVTGYTDTFRVNMRKLGVHDTLICFRNFPDTLNIPGTAPGKYFWNTGDRTASVKINRDGKYWRQTIDTPCVNFTDTIVVGYLKDAGINIVKCIGGSPLFITGSPIIAKYKWNTGDTVSGITVNSAGIYWRQTRDNICVNFTDTIKVKQNIKATDSIACVPSLPTTLGGPAATNGSYLWNTGDNTATITINDTGIYWRHTWDGVCIDYTDTLNVGIAHNIQLDTVICTNLYPITLTGKRDPAITQYQWNTNQYGVNITVPHAGYYWLHATGFCFDLVDSIIVNDTPRVVFKNMDTVLCTGTNPVIGIDEPGVFKYAWNNGATNCCISPKESGLYIVTISNECGTLSDSINVTLSDCSGDIELPKAFTPNGDGVNDILYVRGKNIVSVAFMIFDRWGNKVFETNDIHTGWDGKYKGTPQPVEIYAWVVKAGFRDGTSGVKKGSVNLLR